MENKYKKTRIAILISWAILGALLLIVINTQGYSDRMDLIVKIFIYSSPVIAGLIGYFKSKESRAKKS